MIRKGFLSTALLLFFGLTNLYAQGTTGQISGTVMDQNGAVAVTTTLNKGKTKSGQAVFKVGQ